MDRLVLHPTEIAQWHALINEAQLALAINLSEELESYLVFLLSRFCNHPELISSILALDFLEAHQSVGKVRDNILRDVGDKSLLFSGLFPGLARRRNVQISYFIDLGKQAYASLSNFNNTGQNNLYAELAHGFVILMDLLQTVRDLTNPNTLLPLEALELWQRAHSQYAANQLDPFIYHGIIINPLKNN